MKKKVMMVCLGFVIILGAQLSIFSAQTSFYRTYVDSNTHTYITRADKQFTNKIANAIITNIYNTNGQEDYTYVKLIMYNAYTAEQLSGEIRVPKGTTSHTLDLNQTVYAGTNISLFAMGNDPRYDCLISGIFTTN